LQFLGWQNGCLIVGGEGYLGIMHDAGIVVGTAEAVYHGGFFEVV